MRMPLVAAAVVSGSVGLLLVSQLSAQRPAAAPAHRDGIAVLSMADIMKHSERFKKDTERLKVDYEKQGELLKKEGERGNKLTEDLRTLPANSPERKQVEQQVLKARADYELHGKRVTEDARDAETKIVLGLIKDMQDELARFARANQIELILRTDPPAPDLSDPRAVLQEIHKPIVYQRSPDVTGPVLQAMNARAGAPAATTARPPVTNRPAAPR